MSIDARYSLCGTFGRVIMFVLILLIAIYLIYVEIIALGLNA